MFQPAKYLYLSCTGWTKIPEITFGLANGKGRAFGPHYTQCE